MADGRDHPMHDPVADDHDASADAMARTWGPNGVEAAFLHEGDSYSLMLNESIGPLVDKSTGTALFGNRRPGSVFGDDSGESQYTGILKRLEGMIPGDRRPDTVFGDETPERQNTGILKRLQEMTPGGDGYDYGQRPPTDFSFSGTAEDPPEFDMQEASISEIRRHQKAPPKVRGRELTFNRGRHESAIQNASTRWDVDADLIAAVIDRESGWDPGIVGTSGEVGLMQLMASTAADMGVEDRADATQNINGGVKYLAMLGKMFGDDVELVLTAYNSGLGRLKRKGMLHSPSRQYVADVMDRMDAYKTQ